MAKRIVHKIDRFLKRCRETACPKCGWFLSKFVAHGFNPKSLKQCYNCRSDLRVQGKHIVVVNMRR